MRTDWPVKKLGEVAVFQKGKMMPNSSSNTAGSAPYILIDDLRSGNYAHFTQSNQGTACLPTDSLLVWDGANAGTVGGGLQGFVGSTISKISPAEEIDPSFLNLFLSSKSGEFNKQVHGAAIPHLNKDFVHALPVIIPPLNIQKKIVERLDAIRKSQELCDQQIQKTEELLESLIYKEIEKSNSKITTLGEICNFEGGTQPPKSTFVYIPQEGYVRLLQIRDYKSDKDAVYIPIKERHKTCVETDIMIGRYGPPVSQILKGKAGAYNVALMKCVPNSALLSNKWLYYFLRSKPIQDRIISLSIRARQSGVRPSDLNELRISLPNLTEQQKIIEKLEAVQNYKKLLLKQKSLLKELFDSVLDKSMKGELDN